MALFLRRVFAGKPLYEWFVMILFVGLLKFNCGFLKSQPLCIMSHQFMNIGNRIFHSRHWMFRAALIFSFLYYLKKKHKKLDNMFIERFDVRTHIPRILHKNTNENPQRCMNVGLQLVQ